MMRGCFATSLYTVFYVGMRRPARMPVQIFCNKFETNVRNFEKKHYFCPTKRCPGGEMVDALVSGASAARRAGSSPVLGTQKRLNKV